MTTQVETTYDIEGRLLEVCNCEAICPCWVGLDPDAGTCDSIFAWAVDKGTIQGVDVSDRILGLSVHIPGNVLAGNWKAVVYIDDRCDEEQQQALLSVFTGQLTTLADTAFSTIPGSPAYPGRAISFRRDASAHGLADINVSGRNALQGAFHFSA